MTTLAGTHVSSPTVPVESGTHDRAPLIGVSGRTYLATLAELAPSGPAKVSFIGVLVSRLNGIGLYKANNTKLLQLSNKLRQTRSLS